LHSSAALVDSKIKDNFQQQLSDIWQTLVHSLIHSGDLFSASSRHNYSEAHWNWC